MAGHLEQPTISQGFKTYMGFIARSGLPQVKATCERYLGMGNRNARFSAYVEEFGDNWPRQDDSLNDRQDVLEALLDEESESATPAPTRRRNRRSSNRMSVGDHFTYHGKRRNTTWTILKVGYKWTTKGGRKHEGYLARNSEGRENGWAFPAVERMLRSNKIER